MCRYLAPSFYFLGIADLTPLASPCANRKYYRPHPFCNLHHLTISQSTLAEGHAPALRLCTLVLSFLYKTTPKYYAIHSHFNFQETFLVDKLSNGANPESRRCVVRAVARRKKEEDDQFPTLTKHIRISSCKKESKFRGLFHVWL